VVVLAGLGWRFNLQDLREDILLDGKYGLCPKVARPDGEQRYPSLPYFLARQRQRRELLGEELRLLYVAMTRACDTLILTATSPRQGDPTWDAADERDLTDSELLSARSYLDWLMLWLPQATRETDWVNEQEGRNGLVHWKIHDRGDPLFVLPGASRSSPDANETARGSAPAAVDALRTRLEWRYSHEAATREPAKTSVTGLRRRLRNETDDEARRLFQASDFGFQVRSQPDTPTSKLTAADLGTAHHTFLQMASLDRLGSVRELEAEAERLRREGVLSGEEIAALDLAALADFWRSDAGRQILAQRAHVHREIPFTARLAPQELAQLNLLNDTTELGGEFLVVQGFVDLAVILAKEIWVADFKTDQTTREQLREKVEFYKPQLKLYGLALSRIYGRPITESWLHFFRLGKTVALR